MFTIIIIGTYVHAVTEETQAHGLLPPPGFQWDLPTSLSWHGSHRPVGHGGTQVAKRTPKKEGRKSASPARNVTGYLPSTDHKPDPLFRLLLGLT